MTEAEAIQTIRHHLENLFPKVCPKCQRTFATLREYQLNTKNIGPPMSYDAEMGRWHPLRPVGAVSLANCPCGTTLALSSEGMPLFKLWRLLNWARIETRRRGVSQQELLSQIRDVIRRQVLDGP